MGKAGLVRASLGRAGLERASLPSFVSENALRVVERGQLIPGSTFTRDDTANEFDSDGIMQTAAANEARTTYIDGVPYLWVDGEVTEISGRSFDLGNWSTVTTATVVKDAVGLDGQASTAFTVTDNSDSSAQKIQQNITISDDTEDYYAVGAIKKVDSPSVYPRVFFVLSVGTTSQSFTATFDPSDGTWTVGNNDGNIVLTILIDGFWHFVIRLTNNGTGNTNSGLAVLPALNTTGAVGGDPSATGSTVVAYMARYKSNFSLMPILTTGGTTKTVAGDVASLMNSIISGMTEGAIYAEVWITDDSFSSNNHVAELRGSTLNDRIEMRRILNGAAQMRVTAGGVEQFASATTPWGVGVLRKAAVVFGPSGFAFYVDGSQIGTGTGTVPSMDTLLIGAGLFGGIKTMNVHTSEWSKSTGEARTS